MDDAALRDDQSKLNDMHSQLAELRTYMAPGHAKIVRLEAQIAFATAPFFTSTVCSAAGWNPSFSTRIL